MRKYLLFIAFLLFSMIANAQEISLGNGTSSGSAPLNPYFGGSIVQQIFLKQEINAAASGTLTGLKFYGEENQSFNNTNYVEFWLGHTTKNSFDSNTDWVSLSGLTRVYAGIIESDLGLTEITFSTPFAYNNTDNLILVGYKPSVGTYDSYSDRFYNYQSFLNTTLYYNSDSITIDSDNLVNLQGTTTNLKSNISFIGLNLSSIPTCGIINSPSNNETNVDLLPIITWQENPLATGYYIKIGTTAGGSDVLNELVSNSPFTFSGNLNYSSDYYLTIETVTATGVSVNCSSTKFTTQSIDCPSLNAPENNQRDVVLQPTISWGAVAGAAGYKISIGTSSGGTNILNNVDVGNVTSYNLSSSLLGSTTYFMSVSAYTSSNTSVTPCETTFVTVCEAGNVPYSMDFSDSINYNLPICTNVITLNSGDSWEINNYNNDSYLYFPFSWSNESENDSWFYTKGINLVAGTSYFIEYDFSVNSDYSTENFKVSYGLQKNASSMTTLAMHENIDNESIENNRIQFTPNVSGVYYFGFHYYSPVFSSGMAVDNIFIDAVGTCERPLNLIYTNRTNAEVTITWNSSSTIPANGYEIYFSSTNVLPTNATATVQNISSNTYTFTNLQPNSINYAWVRSVCSATDSSSWSNVITIATTPLNDECSNAIVLIPGANFSQNELIANNMYSTINTNDPEITCDVPSESSTGKDIWYTVTVPADGNITIETNRNTGSLVTDTGLSVYTGDCDSLVEIECNADSSDDGNFSKIILTGRTAGEDLLIRTWGYGNNVGTYKISAYNETLSNNNFVLNEVKIYPNPFTSELNISNFNNLLTISVVDISGKIVKVIKNPSQTLPLNELQSGIYMIILQGQDGAKITKKVIKK